jgi:hypothetical protein
MVFRSKIDAWLGLLLLAAGGMVAGASVQLMVAPIGAARLLGLPLLAFGAGLPLWLLATTRYAVEPELLRIYSGPLRWVVPLREITRVARSRNPLSAPALSLDRLRIDYGSGRWCLVSPADREGFLRALRARGVPVAE